jgi:hypothetical protein
MSGLTIYEAAEYSGVAPRELHEAVARGELPATPVMLPAGELTVMRRDLDAWWRRRILSRLAAVS